MKIVLSGFYGAGNTGDEAILEAILDNLREYLDSPEITVLSLSPEQTSKLHNVHSVYRAWRRENKEKWLALKEADLLISGGGGLLQDTYPTKIISGPLPYYLLVVWLAKLSKTKVMFFSQGIGPVNTSYGKWLMKRFANMADLITVRDEHSKDLLETLSVTKPETYVTSDIVFAFKQKPDNSCLISLPEKWKSKKDSLIGVSVRPWFDNKAYFKEIAESLDLIIEKSDVLPVFVPMEGMHDVQASEEVIRLMKHGQECTILGTNFSPNQYLNFISETKLTIGMRLHALIFSTIAHVPHIGISYDPKVESLLKRNGLWKYSFELENIDSIQLAENANIILKNESEVRKGLSEAAENLKSEALKNIQLLKTYFNK